MCVASLKLALLKLEPNYNDEPDDHSPADCPWTERGQSVHRTLRSLQEQLPEDPLESELLLVSVLQRTISSQLTPGTPRRPSVIHQTPPVTPLNHLSPLVPATTPESVNSDLDSVFTPVIKNPLEQSSEDDLSSAKTPTGESINLVVNSTASSVFSRSTMAGLAEITEQLDDIEDEAEFTFRNFPANKLDEECLIGDYEKFLDSLNSLARKYSRSVRKLTNLQEAGNPQMSDTWKNKMTKFEEDLNLYRREVRRSILDLRGQSNNPGIEVQPSLHRNSTELIAAQPGQNVSSVSTLAQEHLILDQNKAAREKKLATAKAKCSFTTIKQDMEDLTAEYSEHTDWQEADDSDVQKAMNNVKTWKDKMSKVTKDAAELESIVTGQDLDDLGNDLSRLKLQVSKTNLELQEAIFAVNEADTEKGLFSNRKTLTTPKSFPTFSGSPGEDFLEFSTKFEKAVLQTRFPSQTNWTNCVSN